jgi:hypothetical protein
METSLFFPLLLFGTGEFQGISTWLTTDDCWNVVAIWKYCYAIILGCRIIRTAWIHRLIVAQTYVSPITHSCTDLLEWYPLSEGATPQRIGLASERPKRLAVSCFLCASYVQHPINFNF